ncbi:MAG: nucleotide sugar dehydrogenase, partial [Chloroflexota bacterium]
IGLVNEVALICDKLGLDTWEVVEAAATKPYGFMAFYPGPGLGGHCIPVDPLYLSWKLRTLNYTARFIELASEVNSHMPDHVVSKIANALNDESKAVKGSRILILGVAYKPNVADLRESPAVDIIHLLNEMGALVTFSDPYVDNLADEGLDTPGVELNDENLSEADCVVVVTHHSAFDWPRIGKLATLIVDTRHVIGDEGRARVVTI